MPDQSGKAEGNRYACNFEIARLDGKTILKVKNPWQNAAGLGFRYTLCKDDPPSPGTDTDCLIKVPVRRVVVTSTTHVSFLHELGKTGSIAGISGKKYIYNRQLLENMMKGKVKDVGYDQNLNYEVILSMDPDVVFAYGVTGEVYNHLSRLQEMNIPVVFVSEYLEQHPLGKAEWIRFMAAFYDMHARADSIFGRICAEYERLAKLAAVPKDQPAVLSGLPWKDTWWVPGGRSFAARLIGDAGGRYLWEDDPSFTAIPLDIESVFRKALQADIWINPGSAGYLEEIKAADPRLAEMNAFKQESVYNNNARLNEQGGNDYWESGVCHPELILSDLIKIFHPEVLLSHRPVYYRKLGPVESR